MVTFLSVHGDVCPRLSKHFGLVNDKIQTVKVGEIVDWLVGIVEDSRYRLKGREVGKEGGRRGEG